MGTDKDTFWDDLGKDNAAARERMALHQNRAGEQLSVEDMRFEKAKGAVRMAFDRIADRLQGTGCRVVREWAKDTQDTSGLYISADSLPLRILLEADIAPNGGVLVSINEEGSGDKRAEFAYPPEAVSVPAMVVAFDSAFRTVVARHRIMTKQT
jgi:hypothetical protein